jgi:outer membrane lipoprotein SlyB
MMSMMNAHVLGTAVLNVTANTRGLEYALADTKRQMNGFMTFANAFGGKLGGAIGGVFGSAIYNGGGGLQAVANAMAGARQQHVQNIAAWRTQMPNANQFQGPFGVFQQAPYTQAMAQWRAQRPNLAQAQQQAVQGAAVEAGRVSVVVAAVIGSLEKLAVGLKAAAETASDYVEAVAKTEQTFGSNKGIVGRQAESLASQYGVSRRETHALSSSAGLLLQGSGIDEKSSAEMGARLAKLAAEASSFYNVPVEEAMRRIQSGLSGMARPLREFGVLITEAKVSTKAFEMGLVGTNGVVTDGAKTIARYALITQGLARSEGDIARSQDRYSMQIRMLQGNFENLAATIGESVLPAFTMFTSFANEAIQATERWWKGLGSIGGAIGGVVGKAIYGGETPANFDANTEVPDAQPDIDARNQALIQDQLKLDAEQAAMKSAGRGAGRTDIQGLARQIQDAISGSKDAMMLAQVDILKRTEEIQKKQLKAIEKLANKPATAALNGVPF